MSAFRACGLGWPMFLQVKEQLFFLFGLSINNVKSVCVEVHYLNWACSKTFTQQ